VTGTWDINYEHAVPWNTTCCTHKQSTTGVRLIALQYHQGWPVVPNVSCRIVFHHHITDYQMRECWVAWHLNHSV